MARAHRGPTGPQPWGDPDGRMVAAGARRSEGGAAVLRRLGSRVENITRENYPPGGARCRVTDANSPDASGTMRGLMRGRKPERR